MKNVQSLLNRLEAQARADLDAQARVQSALGVLADAVRTGKPAEVGAATASLKLEIDAGRSLTTRRTAVLQACAEHFGVPASMVTLSSLAERFGPGAERLRELRAELRAAAAAVVRAQRRVAASIRCQRRVIGDVLGVLLANGGKGGIDPFAEQGTLVDAKV